MTTRATVSPAGPTTILPPGQLPRLLPAGPSAGPAGLPTHLAPYLADVFALHAAGRTEIIDIDHKIETVNESIEWG